MRAMMARNLTICGMLVSKLLLSLTCSAQLFSLLTSVPLNSQAAEYTVYAPVITTNRILQGVIRDMVTNSVCQYGLPELVSHFVHRGTAVITTEIPEITSSAWPGIMKYTADTRVGTHGYSIRDSSPLSVLKPGSNYYAQAYIYIPTNAAQTSRVILYDQFNQVELDSTSTKGSWQYLGGLFTATNRGADWNYILIMQDTVAGNTDSFYVDNARIFDMAVRDEASYIHQPSIESWNGKLYGVFQGRRGVFETGIGTTLRISESSDGSNWSDPVAFLLGTSGISVNPTRPAEDMKANGECQGHLLAYNTNELWCAYVQGSRIGLSKYNGTVWTNTIINELSYPNIVTNGNIFTNSEAFNPYTAADLVKLSSGRVVLPLTLVSRTYTYQTNYYNTVITVPYRYICLAYSDDAGNTWKLSNLVTDPSEPGAAWEAFLHEQHDGLLRVFCRNFIIPSTGVNGTPSLYTTTATGVELGSPIVLEEVLFSDTVANRNTASSMQLDGRYIMFHNDAYINVPSYTGRQNGSLYFSHSGKDDFVDGISFSAQDEIMSTVHGTEKDGKLFMIHASENYMYPRGIDCVTVNPAPAGDKLYIMPRGRRFTSGSYVQPCKITDGTKTNCLQFIGRGGAGIEIRKVDFDLNDELFFEFDFKVTQLQVAGRAVIFSYGDNVPARFAVDPHHTGFPTDRLQVFTASGWQDIGEITVGAWYRVRTTFNQSEFTAWVSGGTTNTYGYPSTDMNPRLYFGDGYFDESITYSNNIGSTFLVDVDSVRHTVTPFPEQDAYARYTFSNGTDGWYTAAGYNCTVAAEYDALKVTATGNDPYIRHDFTALDAYTHKVIGLLLRSSKISGDVMLKWKTNKDGLFDNTNKVAILTNAITVGEGYQYVEFDLSDNPYWKDTILSLLVFPAKNASNETGNAVAIDSIVIMRPVTPGQEYARYTFTGSTEDWYAATNYNCTVAAESSALKVTATGNDPFIRHDYTVLDADTYKFVGVTLNSSQISGDIILKWKTDQSPLFDANKTVTLNGIVADTNAYQYVEFDLSGNTNWTGNVRSLLLFPAKNGSNETGNVSRIDCVDIFWKP